MVFGFLRPPVSLLVEPVEASPVGPVRLRVVVDARKPVELRRLRAGLLVTLEGRARCEVTEEGEEGEETYTRVEDYSLRLAGLEREILRGARLGRGRREYTVTLSPERPLPPPGDYGAFRVRWRAWAEAPGRLRAVKATAPVEPGPAPGEGPRLAEKARLAGGLLEASVPGYAVRGRPFRVGLRLSALSGPVECRGLQASLRSETVIDGDDIAGPGEDCDTRSESRLHGEWRLADRLSLAPGEAYEAGLIVVAPAGAPPSFDRGDTFNRWFLRVSCRKGLLGGDEALVPLTVI